MKKKRESVDEGDGRKSLSADNHKRMLHVTGKNFILNKSDPT